MDNSLIKELLIYTYSLLNIVIEIIAWVIFIVMNAYN